MDGSRDSLDGVDTVVDPLVAVIGGLVGFCVCFFTIVPMGVMAAESVHRGSSEMGDRLVGCEGSLVGMVWDFTHPPELVAWWSVDRLFG